MKFYSMCGIFGSFADSFLKKKIPDKKIRKAVKDEYKAVIERADDIGEKNNLLSSYILAAYFIAMCRCDGLSPSENRDLIKDGMYRSRLFKMMMGSADNYFSPKKMDFRRKWAEETKKKKYKNDWVLNFLEKTDDFEFGFDYLECGVVKLCRDEGCPELAKYLCSLDFAIVDVMGIKLDRTMTLAEGFDHCDFRFSRNK